MANYKRGKCRYHVPRAIRGSETSWRKHNGLKPTRLPDRWWADLPIGSSQRKAYWPGHRDMMNSYPAWWDRMFHTRPTRAATRRLARDVLRGRVDPDGIVWPHHHRPHRYHW